MEIGELSKSGIMFSALKLSTGAKYRIEMRNQQLALKLKKTLLQ